MAAQKIERTLKPCEICGEPVPFRRRDSTGTYEKKRFCSLTCAGIGRSNDNDHGGDVPSKQSLINWIESESERGFPEYPDRCPKMEHYIYNHPRGWCGHLRLLRVYGYPGTREGWNQLAIDLTGRHVYTPAEYNTAMAARRWGESVIDERPERLGDSERKQAQDGYDYGDWGLRVVEKERPILVWYYPTQEYKPAGYELVMVVC